MWWKWAIILDTGAYSSGGSSFSTIGYALDAALHAAMLRAGVVAEIHVFPTR